MTKVLAAIVLLSILVSCAAVNFNIGEATKRQYSEFLQKLRDEAKDKALQYSGVPVLPPPPQPATFLFVGLNVTHEISVTLALNRSNIYLIGYCDKYQHQDRAHFFDDAPKHAISSLFPNAKGSNRIKLTYRSNYNDIQFKAGIKGDRSKLPLGVEKLKNRIEKLYERSTNTQTEAEFFLLAIQLISEAARFKYIENQVLSNFGVFEFNPNPKLIGLENEWGKISGGLKNADSAGNINPALTLKDETGKEYKVTKVSEVKPDVSLLKFGGE